MTGGHADDLAALHRLLSGLIDVPEDQWLQASARFESRAFAVGEHLVRAGEPMPSFFFLAAGLVRFYYLTAEGKEANKAFHAESEFVGNFPSHAVNTPCRFFVQALEPTRAVLLPRAELVELYGRHHTWERLGRLQAERVAARKIEREAQLLLDSAQTRYETFLHERPELAKRLPQYHIASFLGITDVALSRIRRRMRGRL